MMIKRIVNGDAATSRSTALVTQSQYSPPPDTFVDHILDWLRDHKLPAIIEILLAWWVSSLCLLYYCVSFVKLKQSRQPHTVPLVAQAMNTTHETVPYLKELLQLRTREERIRAIRHSLELRHKVSSYMMSPHQSKLKQELQDIWLDLLKFPPPPSPGQRFRISLVVSVYQESNQILTRTLKHALHTASNPSTIQVIVVDAGKNADPIPKNIDGFGDYTVISTHLNGRGPCQNVGAQHAQAPLLVFLHADTLLPQTWDASVVDTLGGQNHNRTQACAFCFGHNVAHAVRYPYGIRSVWMLGNVRAWLCSLPYGDHILCMSKHKFDHVGGFPNRPIMEDYDLMDLLRRRARVLPEEIQIIPSFGHCSVRRWEKFGVVYVTLVNALVVHRYVHQGWTAQDIYHYYYERRQGKKRR